MRMNTLTIRKVLIYCILFYPFIANVLIDKLKIPYASSIDEIIIVLLFCVNLLLHLRGKGKASKQFLTIYFLFICFAFCGFIAILYRVVAWKTLFEGYIFQIKNYFLFILVAGVWWEENDLNKIFKILKKIYIVIVTYSLIAYFLPAIRIFDSIYMTSIFSHPATFATLIVPLAIYSFVEYINSGKKLYIGVFCISIICLLLAGTSKNLVSVAVVCCIYLSRVRKSRKYLFMMMILVGGIIALPQIISIFSEEITTNILSDTAANRPRWLLYGTSFKLASDYFPFGSGFGTFGNSVSFSGRYSDVYSLYGIAGRYGFSQDNILFLSDTYWPSVIGETGIAGVLIVVSLLFSYLKMGSNALRNSIVVSKKLKSRGQVIVLSFIALMIESLFTATFYGIRSYFVIVLMGIFVSIVNNSNKRRFI